MSRSRSSVSSLLFCSLLICSVFATVVYAGIGDPLLNLKPQEAKFYKNGRQQFVRTWGMQEGVGPVLTEGACVKCHSQGAPLVSTPGGGSGRILTFFGKINPDNSFDPLDGTGPSGENEGGLLIQSRSNQAFLRNCTQGGEVAPADANAIENRVAPPTFGFGLIDAIDDLSLTNQAAFEAATYQADNIHGVAGTVPTFYQFAPNTIGRFGRKGQFANLVEMTAFAFAHDLGITNTLFEDEDLPQGQPIDPNCTLNSTVPNNSNTGSGGHGMFAISHFMRYLAPPAPAACTGDCPAGQALFSSVGCDECHKQSYTTKASYRVPTDTAGTTLPSVVLSGQPVNLYSDLLLHDLGNMDFGLIPAGYINTGVATNSQWRTTPLWGLQYRTKFMHDGTAVSIDAAILDHSDGITGEAVSVIGRYKGLSPSDHQALLDFLGTL